MAVVLATDISAHGNKKHLIRSESDTAINESNARTITRTTSVESLAKSLLLKKDLVLDFTSLKSCLDPLSETAAGKDSENGFEQFDYESFVYDCFENGDKFPVLESLVIRNLKLSTNEPTFDNSAYLCHGMMQLSTLVELDIGGNEVPEALQLHLQFWNLYNLKKLMMDSTGLKRFPPSAGRLRKLEILSLNKNKLDDLPVTLGFCENLMVLNLQGNKFRRIPGIVLHLKKLKELRRLDNPLPPRWDGFGSPPHVNVRKQSTSNSDNKKVYNPESLQTFCTKVAFTHQIHYWKHNTLGPLQCKTLDSLAPSFTICENCRAAISKTGQYIVEVMLVSFLELRDVPFVLHACSAQCQEVIKNKFIKRNKDLQRELDEDYEESIRQAQKLVDENKVNISPDNINVPENQVSHFAPTYNYRASNFSRRARRRRGCIVM